MTKKEKATHDAKAAAFKRLAKGRTAAVIKALRVLSKTTNRDSYAYTPEQVEKIMGVIDVELHAVREGFAGVKPRVADLFDFDEEKATEEG